MLKTKREALARTLVTDARLVASVIHGGKKKGKPALPLLVALGACETLAELVHETLQALVDEARAVGHTWQEIGDVLGTSRQAAYQRFGRSDSED